MCVCDISLWCLIISQSFYSSCTLHFLRRLSSILSRAADPFNPLPEGDVVLLPARLLQIRRPVVCLWFSFSFMYMNITYCACARERLLLYYNQHRFHIQTFLRDILQYQRFCPFVDNDITQPWGECFILSSSTSRSMASTGLKRSSGRWTSSRSWSPLHSPWFSPSGPTSLSGDSA